MTHNETVSWIFLAAALASQTEPANLSSISGIADGINHAVPTHQELQTSIAWLTKNGLIAKSGDKYSLTQKGKLLYEESSKKTSNLFKIWENLETSLDKY